MSPEPKKKESSADDEDLLLQRQYEESLGLAEELTAKAKEAGRLLKPKKAKVKEEEGPASESKEGAPFGIRELLFPGTKPEKMGKIKIDKILKRLRWIEENGNPDMTPGQVDLAMRLYDQVFGMPEVNQLDQENNDEVAGQIVREILESEAESRKPDATGDEPLSGAEQNLVDFDLYSVMKGPELKKGNATVEKKKEVKKEPVIALEVLMEPLRDSEFFTPNIARLTPRKLGEKILGRKEDLQEKIGSLIIEEDGLPERIEELAPKVSEGRGIFASQKLFDEASKKLAFLEARLQEIPKKITDMEAKKVALEEYLAKIKTVAGALPGDDDRTANEKVEKEFGEIIDAAARNELKSIVGIRNFLLGTLYNDKRKDAIGDWGEYFKKSDDKKLDMLSHWIRGETKAARETLEQKTLTPGQQRRLDFLNKIYPQIFGVTKGEKVEKKEFERLISQKVQQLFFTEGGEKELAELFKIDMDEKKGDDPVPKGSTQKPVAQPIASAPEAPVAFQEKLGEEIEKLEEEIKNLEALISYLDDTGGVRDTMDGVEDLNNDIGWLEDDIKNEAGDHSPNDITGFKEDLQEKRRELAESQAKIRQAEKIGITENNIDDKTVDLRSLKEELENLVGSQKDSADRRQWLAELEGEIKAAESGGDGDEKDRLVADKMRIEGEFKECQEDIKKSEQEIARLKAALGGLLDVSVDNLAAEEVQGESAAENLEKTAEELRGRYIASADVVIRLCGTCRNALKGNNGEEYFGEEGTQNQVRKDGNLVKIGELATADQIEQLEGFILFNDQLLVDYQDQYRQYKELIQSKELEKKDGFPEQTKLLDTIMEIKGQENWKKELAKFFVKFGGAKTYRFDKSGKREYLVLNVKSVKWQGGEDIREKELAFDVYNEAGENIGQESQAVKDIEYREFKKIKNEEDLPKDGEEKNYRIHQGDPGRATFRALPPGGYSLGIKNEADNIWQYNVKTSDLRICKTEKGVAYAEACAPLEIKGRSQMESEDEIDLTKSLPDLEMSELDMLLLDLYSADDLDRLQDTLHLQGEVVDIYGKIVNLEDIVKSIDRTKAMLLSDIKESNPPTYQGGSESYVDDTLGLAGTGAFGFLEEGSRLRDKVRSLYEKFIRVHVEERVKELGGLDKKNDLNSNEESRLRESVEYKEALEISRHNSKMSAIMTGFNRLSKEEKAEYKNDEGEPSFVEYAKAIEEKRGELNQEFEEYGIHLSSEVFYELIGQGYLPERIEIIDDDESVTKRGIVTGSMVIGCAGTGFAITLPLGLGILGGAAGATFGLVYSNADKIIGKKWADEISGGLLGRLYRGVKMPYFDRSKLATVVKVSSREDFKKKIREIESELSQWQDEAVKDIITRRGGKNRKKKSAETGKGSPENRELALGMKLKAKPGSLGLAVNSIMKNIVIARLDGNKVIVQRLKDGMPVGKEATFFRNFLEQHYDPVSEPAVE